jgi:hypothetical protein
MFWTIMIMESNEEPIVQKWVFPVLLFLQETKALSKVANKVKFQNRTQGVCVIDSEEN